MKNQNLTPQTEVAPTPVRHAIVDAKPVSGETVNARLVTGSDLVAGAIVQTYLKTTTTDLSAILDALQEQGKAIHQGDMRQVESMLIGQAVALQTMFCDFALRAKNAKPLKDVQCLAQLALRSQAGSRSTLQTLADVKNPRQVAFVKQTNVANTQQVNNGLMPSSHVENITATPNELLVEENHGSTTLDTRAKTKASRADPAVVTVDGVDRPAKRRR